ncbi:MAG: hypothetical protein LBO05_06450, partial [Deltaproteobacteria bacterium]|nr:hypothetical protein [Deltaproteobacteria bacterium]
MATCTLAFRMDASQLTTVSLPSLFSRALPISLVLGCNGLHFDGKQFDLLAQLLILSKQLVFLLLQLLVLTLKMKCPLLSITKQRSRLLGILLASLNKGRHFRKLPVLIGDCVGH